MNIDPPPATRPHWSECIEEIRERVRGLPRVLVASDFDGTLSPIVDHPAAAVLEPTAPAVLDRLAALHPRVRLAFLSGRSLEDLAPRLGHVGRNAILGGNHGLELRGPDFFWTHPCRGETRALLHRMLPQLRRIQESLAGVEIEDKDASVTLHYRRMDGNDTPALLEMLDRIHIPDQIRLHEGKKVFEFRPHVDWHKGSAIRKIADHLSIDDHAIIFLGDDVTDEDAFKELSQEAFTIRVGPASEPSAARISADDPADAVRFLNRVFTSSDSEK